MFILVTCPIVDISLAFNIFYLFEIYTIQKLSHTQQGIYENRQFQLLV